MVHSGINHDHDRDHGPQRDTLKFHSHGDHNHDDHNRGDHNECQCGHHDGEDVRLHNFHIFFL